MGRESPFTSSQDAFIESYMDAFEAEARKYDVAFMGTTTHRNLTIWKQEKTKEISKSELFGDHLICEGNVTEKTWADRIMRRFSNHLDGLRRRKGVRVKDGQDSSSETLIRLTAKKSALQVFEEENKELIKSRAADACPEGSSFAAFYQKAKSEMWNEIQDNEDELNIYREKAQDTGNISDNQKDFMKAAWKSLRSLCRGGKLGDAEMMLFFGFRKEDGHIGSGCVSGHCPSNDTDLSDTMEDFDACFNEPWNRYLEVALPTFSVPNNDAEIIIPINENSKPIFPSINLDEVSPGHLRKYVNKYLEALWVYSESAQEFRLRDIPWKEFALSSSNYYDIKIHKLPVVLQHPEELSVINLIALVDYFLQGSKVENNSAAFEFFSKEIILQNLTKHNPARDDHNLSSSPSPNHSRDPSIHGRHDDFDPPSQSSFSNVAVGFGKGKEVALANGSQAQASLSNSYSTPITRTSETAIVSSKDSSSSDVGISNSILGPNPTPITHTSEPTLEVGNEDPSSSDNSISDTIPNPTPGITRIIELETGLVCIKEGSSVSDVTSSSNIIPNPIPITHASEVTLSSCKDRSLDVGTPGLTPNPKPTTKRGRKKKQPDSSTTTTALPDPPTAGRSTRTSSRGSQSMTTVVTQPASKNNQHVVSKKRKPGYFYVDAEGNEVEAAAPCKKKLKGNGTDSA